MWDVVEIRNIDGEKINVHLEENKTPSDDLGEFYAQIRIGNEPYMLVAERSDDPRKGDVEGRAWKIVHPKKMTFPDSFFERENAALVIQMIAPHIGEEKLTRIQAILEEKTDEQQVHARPVRDQPQG